VPVADLAPASITPGEKKKGKKRKGGKGKKAGAGRPRVFGAFLDERREKRGLSHVFLCDQDDRLEYAKVARSVPS